MYRDSSPYLPCRQWSRRPAFAGDGTAYGFHESEPGTNHLAAQGVLRPALSAFLGSIIPWPLPPLWEENTLCVDDTPRTNALWYPEYIRIPGAVLAVQQPVIQRTLILRDPLVA